MRRIFLDTETTGLEVGQGHRIIEVAAIEMRGRRLTGKALHHYVNPEREIDPGAQKVHGISLEFLQDKPLFHEIAAEFAEFVRGAELFIHNAPFDLAFLNAEMKRISLAPIEQLCSVVDTLKMAKELHPGQKNNLDALCRRYQVDSTKRTLHGALTDTELLAEVYLGMTRGQDCLVIEEAFEREGAAHGQGGGAAPREPLVLAATPEELAHHHALLDDLDRVSHGACLWRQSAAAAR